MEVVLESKLIENIDLNKVNMNYYSVYSLKTNRSETIETSSNEAPITVTQFLDQNLTVNKDFSLSLISQNLPAVNESRLREGFAKKIEKGTFYASQSGNIVTFSLSFFKDEEEIESICYYNYYRQSGNCNNQYLVCFILVDGSSNLDLFRNELDIYFETNLKAFLEDSDKELVVSNQLDSFLSNWFSNSIGYLYRALELLKDNMSVFIETAFSCESIEFENLPEHDIVDLNLLFKSFECSQLMLENCVQKKQNSTLVLTMNKEGGISFSRSEDSQFSNECGTRIIEVYNGSRDFFRIKEIIENYKLKLIQDLNTFNRYLCKGKCHYYDLYKALLHLKYSQNSNILIRIYNNFGHKDMGMIDAFNIVIEFYANKRVLEDSAKKQLAVIDEIGKMNVLHSESLLKRFNEKFN